MTELTGFPELTPYEGGWCGNDVSQRVFTDAHAHAPARCTQRWATGSPEGYRGYFELDFLVDAVTGEMYLGELNPRVTGASSMTNVTAVAYGDMPLFLFHLLEFMDVEYEIDVDELNERWARRTTSTRGASSSSRRPRTVELLDRGAGLRDLAARRRTARRTCAATPTGTRRRRATRPSTCASPDAGGYRYPGADLGILVTRGRFMNDDHELTTAPRPGSRAIKASSERPGRPRRDRPRRRPSRSRFKML